MRIGRLTLREAAVAAVFAISALLLAISFVVPRSSATPSAVCDRTERILSQRMAILEGSIHHPEGALPEDMVIYHYSGDTLRDWRNQFSVHDDDISSRTVIQRLSNLRTSIQSPLVDVSDTLGFYNFGPRWYIAKRVVEGEDTYIIGLEIQNTLDEKRFGGVNRKLRLPDRYTIKPLSTTGGFPVEVGGVPLFKVGYDSLYLPVPVDPVLLWLAVLVFIIASLLFVLDERVVWRSLMSTGGVILAMSAIYLWGRSATDDFVLFSPTLYAGGRFLSSLGALVVVNMTIFFSVLNLYLVRKDVFHRIDSMRAVIAWSSVDVIAIFLIILFAHNTLESVIMDSGISLELYRMDQLSGHTVLVYVSFLTLLMSVPLLLQMLQPVFARLFGHHPDLFSRTGRLITAIVIAVYMVVVGARHGFEKEQSMISLWANRLSVDRDITLELQLKMAEKAIAEDAVIGSLAQIEGTEQLITNLVSENYFRFMTQDYGLRVLIHRDNRPDPQVVSAFGRRLTSGVPISDGSAFVFNERPDGRTTYSGIFLYFSESSGIVRVLLDVQPKSVTAERGYNSLAGMSTPGKVTIPSRYSYARYKGETLGVFRGKYAYPTRLTKAYYDVIYGSSEGYFVLGGYVHFVNRLSDSEAVVISRNRVGFMNYVVETVFLALVAYLFLSILALRRKTRKTFENSYYKPRIAWVLMTSLILTLVAMAAVSVMFVYDRNESNQTAILTDRINSVQALVLDALTRQGPPHDDAKMMSALRTVSENTGCDITVYAPDGLVRMSTVPEVFDRMVLGCRIDEHAFESIMRLNKRFFIHKEKIGGRPYFSLYAPLVGPESRIEAILCVPYVDADTDFQMDAAMHMAMILTIFLILFLIARAMATAVIDRMFKPLIELGSRMKTTDLDTLESIEYDREDEIATLVRSYNEMVAELSENSKVMAQAERDKAWSGMARQVAHEIKNPLTPMKLQIQRIMRLKEKNAPNWEQKFDEVSGILLDQIDILSDTANEFSTFAKLYSEDPVRINLDTLLQEEISMFDNRDGLQIQYFGLKDSWTMGPKPQLTRVLWNLLGNACQALEDSDSAVIIVSLRNSSLDGFYDIVFEDNGPGVSEENIDKLFTPNFTTKSSGSGLGLAMSRSILDQCGARISYSRSFSLGGACFTINYPKRGEQMQSKE